jgi:hypothetical protein
MERTELFRLNGAVERDPAIDEWMKEHTSELGAIAQAWFTVMQAAETKSGRSCMTAVRSRVWAMRLSVTSMHSRRT